MRVEEVCRPGTLVCGTTESLTDVARTMVDERVGALAVLDGDQLVGIISERDLVRAIAEGADTEGAAAYAYATHRVETAACDEDTRDVARRMLEAGIRHIPVKRGHEVIGVVSMRDLLTAETWL
ncbi:CBS domain-containing protein [Saccharopolyspora hordei]|uniref:CBS domain-containing protein n=1 Tax=Saccharopolyspora hordei TaxID=1838 RepID=A0A853AJS7_9PSEU|nr:CBS domain-containing protein [Saccharopolyspora hordei]NYI84026.1 CBS domain-containing protein [Saccharopolyspora hordei]